MKMRCTSPQKSVSPTIIKYQPACTLPSSSKLSRNLRGLKHTNQTSSNFSRTITEGMFCLDKKCPNISVIIHLRKHISEINKENENLKKINEYFMKNLALKSEMITTFNQINSTISETSSPNNNKNLIEVIRSAIEKQTTKSVKKQAIIPNDDLKLVLHKKPKTTDVKAESSRKKFDYFKFLTKPKAKNAHEHYDYVTNLVKHKNVKLNQLDSVVSFLSCEIPYLRNLFNNEVFKQMKRISHNKTIFANSLSSLPTDELENVCDYIRGILYDYQLSMTLIIRLKVFLSILFNNHKIESLTTTIEYLLWSCRSVLECQKVFIYLYDPLMDSLVLHQEEHESIPMKNFSVSNGILGHTFTKSELQKINDVDYDLRFDKKVDKDLGFNSKSMLCSPLINSDGQCFGVIQAINKNNIHEVFSVDDEELMILLTRHSIEVILKATDFENNTTYIVQMKNLIRYSVDIKQCTTLHQITALSEKILGELWSVKISQLVYVIEEIKKEFLYINDKNIKCTKQFTGLLRKCYDLKNNVICASSSTDKAYNHLVDIECCFSIITFPIYLENGEIIAIGQVGTTIRYSRTQPNYLNSNDVDILSAFSRILSAALREIQIE